MTIDLDRLADPTQFAVNRMAAHSDHRWFASAAEATTGVSSFEQCLNGTWKFHYAKNPAAVIEGFEQAGHDVSDWDDIPVPAHIQLQGYDRPQYANVQYPWDGHEDIVPGQVPTTFNPVGSYVTHFTLDHPLAEGERLSVMFKGAESAIDVWLNGTWIGYACDSFTPSEFDLTAALVEGENKLACRVYKWSSGSWLEDQDFYRFSGIFRDVVLLRRPTAHLEDLRVRTELDEAFTLASVSVDTQVLGDGVVSAELVGVGALTPAEGGRLQIDVPNPELWSPERPHLYDLQLCIATPEGVVTEHIVQRIGIRRFELRDTQLLMNGKRVVFKGVNRHEFGLQGRVMNREQTEADLVLLKQIGVNAIRTSHYPNNSFFYELADEYGFYVIDEMNLETHGMWDAVGRGVVPLELALPGDRPAWLPALIDRADSIVQRDKNHACVVIWSCGNESYGGRDILEVSNHFRAIDDRPVHYEGVHWDPRYPETTDITSQMYTPAADVEEHLKKDRTKPFILCEFAHAMGNSFGAVDKYLDLAYREPLFQGFFIWDFADQAIELTDRYGKRYFGYGGDCGEAPHDGEFCGNGILFADHTPTPRIPEVKQYYQGLRLEVAEESLLIRNDFLFTNTSELECVVTAHRQGKLLGTSVVETAVEPGGEGTVLLPRLAEGSDEYSVEVSFRLRQPTNWAPAGFEVASAQGVFGAWKPQARTPRRAPQVIDGIHNIGVRGDHFEVLFSKLYGCLVSYRYGHTTDGGREMLKGAPVPNFWHAPTSNERGWQMPAEDGQWLLASRYAVPRLSAGQTEPNPKVEQRDGKVSVTFTLDLPTSPASSCTLGYEVDGDGHVDVVLTMDPGAELPDMPEFGVMLTTQPEFDRLTWYGEGPHESYVDRRASARLGVWTASVADQLTPYLRPQEAGSHTGVRWATVTDRRGRGLRFDAEVPMEFAAQPWTPFEIENAKHHVELPPSHQTVVRPALMRRGVGGDQSWGARTHPEYCLPTGKKLEFRFGFQGIS